MRYILLLRSVNVGGRNKLSMPELKTALEDHGFCDVVTYINSGNILFSSEQTDIAVLIEQCRALIARRFGLELILTIITPEELRAALAHAPDWWGGAKDHTHDAIFVIPPATAEDVLAKVGEPDPELERTDFYGNVIFWSAVRKTYSKTRWAKFFGTRFFKDITMRNANTAQKLNELAQTE